MEHILQIAIGVDDEAIRKRVQESGYNDIIKNLSAELKADLPKKSMYSQDIDWSRVIYKYLEEFCGEHKDEIIEAAAEKVAESIRRSKAMKDKVKEIMADGTKEAKEDG